MITKERLHDLWKKVDDEISHRRGNISATLENSVFRSRMDELLRLEGKMELLNELMKEIK